MSIEVFRIVLGLITSIACMALWPRYVRINAFFSLLFASILFGVIAGIPLSGIISTMQSGFGTLLQQIGIIVALGSVLGMILEKTGAMETISTGLLKAFGEKRPVLAISLIGALVGIPVFCDSGFIILSRLIPSLAIKTSASAGSLVLALSSGLYTTHVLVPPTPGPLAAAAKQMILRAERGDCKSKLPSVDTAVELLIDCTTGYIGERNRVKAPIS